MNLRVVSVGEVLWDVLPDARHLGGAPCNVACHARALGADAAMVTRVGADALGDEVIERLSERGLARETIQVDPSAPTSTVDVTIDAAGQASYIIHADVAWDRLAADAAALERASHADAICFGSLAQRTLAARSAIQQIVRATRPDALRVFDVNLRRPFVDRGVLLESLALANVCKLNDEELPKIATLVGLEASADPRSQIVALAERFELRLIALTRGARGSLLFANGEWSDRPSPPVNVVDTVGAGDSFTAATIIGTLNGWPIEEINRRASEVAAFVCTQPGATPTLPEAMRAAFAAG